MAAAKAERFRSAIRRAAAVCPCGRTALGDLLPRLAPDQLREALIRFVRGEWYRKALRPDRLPLGLAAIDGKVAWSDRESFHPQCQDQSDKRSDKKYAGHRTRVLRVLRAALVSTASRLVHYQQVIPAATNEMGFFAAFLQGLMEAYGRLGMIQAVSVDAGMVSRANLAQVWLVRTLRANPDGTTEVIEERYFLTSLSPRRLKAHEILGAVRDHWGVEYNAHGSADVFFQEDDSPCSKTGEGIVCATLLRLLALNLCQLYRHRRRSAGGKPLAWELLFDDVLFALRLPSAVLLPRSPT